VTGQRYLVVFLAAARHPIFTTRNDSAVVATLGSAQERFRHSIFRCRHCPSSPQRIFESWLRFVVNAP
jgi:hypothetical protein